MDDYEYHNSTYSGLHDGESMHRLLASAEEEEYYVDHAVIGVFVLTLALLLMVEVIRHGVHFMLFYTAILNAIQSCLVRLLTVRRTDKTWLMAEDIEVAHYVAIRKEFDRLERKIKHLNPQYMGSLTERAWPTGGNDSQSSSRRESFKSSVSDLALRIRHPRLYRRRNELLTIIRFHELRVHFIECNNLPPNFKVSSYLDRSLRSVLVDFVHISPLAWISVMAIGNLLFYIAGMILNNTHTIPTVEKFLVLTFMSLMVVFVAIMTVLYFKMRYIFYKIQHLQLDNVIDDDRNNTKS
ncbi:hypothetical protein ACHAW5_006397 [Stephanodiscus triporus]|uniref:Uncharacterized protein n=1 Tax=Stephanodiscus triporus TaxID=2934178 RepID=A0ABD3QTC1_9STRA